MTTETPEPTLTLNDPADGSHVRMRDDLKDDGSTPSKHAGLYGTIYGRDPFGGFLVKIGGKPMHFSRADFIVVAEPSAEQLASTFALDGITPLTKTQPEPAVRLVNAPPLEAINSTTNPRRRRGLDMDSLRALADSILANGLGNPILVRPLPASRLEETSGMEPRPAYEVIAGERRWRAAQLAELPTMPMVVRHMDDRAVLEMQLVENIEREDLDPMEEADGFALLRDKLGYTVEQITERMGKGRGESYVRKRMKLLDLTPESREAMFEGTLTLSTGIAVAKYPPERQAKAVKIIKGMEARGADGTPVPAPFRTVVLELYRKLNTIIKTAAFDTLDPGLVFNAGPCSTCHKRTRADEDLFAEVTDAGEDSCLDSACWEQKKTAHVQRIHVDAKARGLEVIDGDDASKIAPSPYSHYREGYISLDTTAYTETGSDGEEREVTYADALRAQGRKAPKPVVLINPHTSKAEELIPAELAPKLLPKEVVQARADFEERAEAARTPEVQVPEEHMAMRNAHVTRALFIRLFDSVRARPRSVEDLRLVAITLMCQANDAHAHTEAYWGWADAADQEDPEQWLRDKIEGLDAEQLGQLLTMLAMERCLDWYNGHLAPEDKSAEFFTAHGLDILAVRDKVREDLQRQQAAPEVGDENDDDGNAEGEDE